MTKVIQTHISNVMGHWKGQCYCWDVVNEALEENGSYRNSPLYRALGKDFIPISFKQAAQSDPDAKLYYNDYNIENPGAKANAALDIVKNIKSSGARIDGVGFQAHFIVGSTPSKNSLKQALSMFAAEVDEVAYTELDIRHSRVPASTADRNQQSTDYQTVASACLETAKCIGITVWDFADQVCFSVLSCGNFRPFVREAAGAL
jgi:endo-1,4-beta-xylanase